MSAVPHVSEGLRTRAGNAAGLYIIGVFSIGTFMVAALQRATLENAATAGHLVELTIGEFLALAAIARCLLAMRAAVPSIGGRTGVIMVVAALPWLLLEQHVVFLSFTVAGAVLYKQFRTQRPLLDIAQVWLAVSVYELWGKALFKFLSQDLIAVEMKVIAFVGRYVIPGLAVDGVTLRAGSADWFIYIREGCSSYHNISLVILIWISILRIADAVIDRQALQALCESILCVVAMNVLRILAMIPSQDAYLYWHDGAGATLAGCGTVFVAALPVVFRMTLRDAVGRAAA